MKYISTAIYTMLVCHFLRKIYQVMVGQRHQVMVGQRHQVMVGQRPKPVVIYQMMAGQRPKPVATYEPKIKAIYRGPVSKDELGKLMEEFSIAETQESPVSFTGSC